MEEEIKVSQLSETYELNDADVLMVVQSGINKKVKAQNLKRLKNAMSDVVTMKACENLIVGDVVQTLGFYEINDGGGAFYYITDNTDSITEDTGFQILLHNGNVANLIYATEVSILQLGARTQKNNIRYDIHDYIEQYIEENENSTRKFALRIPSGIYYTSPVLINSQNFKIIGESTNTGTVGKTIISAVDDQEYVIKLGDFSKGSGYNVIEGITFSSAVFSDNYSRTSYHTISKACLILSYTYFVTAKYLSFQYIKGSALNINNAWEIWFDKLDFSHINAFEKGIFVFDEVNTTIQGGVSNISDSNFDYMRFEQIIGDCIVFKDNCKAVSLHFGTINVEPSIISDMGYEWGEYDSTLTYQEAFCLIALEGGATFIVDNIQLNNLYHRYHVINGLNYIFGDIIHLRNSDMGYRVVLNTIALQSSNTNVNLVESIGNIYDIWYSKFVINNVINSSGYNMLLKVKNAARIELKSPLSGIQNNNYYVPVYGQMIPCYKNIYNSTYSVRGLINYNEKAVNPEHLTIKNNGLLTSVGKRLFGFLFNSQTLYLRAKIENGQSVNFAVYCYNPNTETYASLGSATLTGTGEFERYSISLNDASKVYGSMAYLQIVDNNVATEIELDTFSN